MLHYAPVTAPKVSRKGDSVVASITYRGAVNREYLQELEVEVCLLVVCSQRAKITPSSLSNIKYLLVPDLQRLSLLYH